MLSEEKIKLVLLAYNIEHKICNSGLFSFKKNAISKKF